MLPRFGSALLIQPHPDLAIWTPAPIVPLSCTRSRRSGAPSTSQALWKSLEIARRHVTPIAHETLAALSTERLLACRARLLSHVVCRPTGLGRRGYAGRCSRRQR